MFPCTRCGAEIPKRAISFFTGNHKDKVYLNDDIFCKPYLNEIKVYYHTPLTNLEYLLKKYESKR